MFQFSFIQKIVFAATTEEGQELVLGLRDVTSKSSDDVLTAFKLFIADIDQRSRSTTSDGGKKLLSQIHATMSDRASTEVRFNVLLKTYREEVIPMIQAFTGELEPEDEASLQDIDTYFCGLHGLVHMAEDAVKSLVEAEKAHFARKNETVPVLSPQCLRSGDGAAGASRLVMATCKAVAKGGDEKSGIHSKAKLYLKETLKGKFGCNILPFSRPVGSRFNLLFRNASRVWGLRKEIEQLLSLNPSNLLLKSALNDIRVPFFRSGARTLGFINSLISTPFWNFVEAKGISMAEMNKIYQRLIDYCDKAAADPSLVMDGKGPFDGKHVKKDPWFDELFKPDVEHDELTKEILAVVMSGLASFGRRQFRDHLEGGVNHVPTTPGDFHTQTAIMLLSIRSSLSSSSVIVLVHRCCCCCCCFYYNRGPLRLHRRHHSW